MENTLDDGRHRVVGQRILVDLFADHRWGSAIPAVLALARL